MSFNPQTSSENVQSYTQAEKIVQGTIITSKKSKSYSIISNMWFIFKTVQLPQYNFYRFFLIPDLTKVHSLYLMLTLLIVSFWPNVFAECPTCGVCFLIIRFSWTSWHEHHIGDIGHSLAASLQEPIGQAAPFLGELDWSFGWNAGCQTVPLYLWSQEVTCEGMLWERVKTLFHDNLPPTSLCIHWWTDLGVTK